MNATLMAVDFVGEIGWKPIVAEADAQAPTDRGLFLTDWLQRGTAAMTATNPPASPLSNPPANQLTKLGKGKSYFA